MRAKYTLAYLILIYVLTQGLGLSVGQDTIEGIRAGVIEPALPEGDNPATSLGLFGYIIAFTVMLLILFKLGLDIIIKVFTYIALYMGVLITFTTLFGKIGPPLSLVYYIAAIAYNKKRSLMNLTLILTVAGIGGFVGASLGVFPALLLLLILAAYDLIAVFWTKHMVTLAEKSKDSIPFMFLIPHGDRNLGLGTGDLAIPLIFTTSVLRDLSITHATITAAGGLIGMLTLFSYIFQKGKITLPALPPIALGLFAGYMISLLI